MTADMLKLMRLLGLCVTALVIGTTPFAACAGQTADCAHGARTFLPCEIQFDLHAGDLPAGTDPYRSETLRIEFRSPNHKTFLMRAFSDGTNTLRVRFSPTEPGDWAYRVSGPIARFNQESSFNVADSGLPGFFAVANVRHWWTTNKQPHLWLSASAPLLSIDSAAFEQWLDARKHDGFTHVRATLLSNASPQRPLTRDGTPDPRYFAELDQRILAAASRGFGIDLILADKTFIDSGAFSGYEQRGALIRYIVARYGALDVSWQGIEHFDETPDGRTLVRSLAESLKKYDTFNHPCSTDARASSSSALRDGWMTFLIEASPNPELGAVEHQFTEEPQVHVVSAVEPDDFRHEIWNATTNGEYLSVSYQALENAANVKAIQVWSHVMAETRHWELEPYFDVDGARAVGLNEVEYLAYAETPAIVEVTLPKHKYNPVWVNPITGEEIELKDYKGLVFSQATPDRLHDWILQVPREGHKAMMLRSYRFESEAPPIQEPELDVSKMPFEIADPQGDAIHAVAPPPYAIKLVRANRATRTMEYVWWGEIVASSEGAHLLGIGPSGTFRMPPSFLQPGASLNVRLLAINANGKAYELDRVYELTR